MAERRVLLSSPQPVALVEAMTFAGSCLLPRFVHGLSPLISEQPESVLARSRIARLTGFVSGRTALADRREWFSLGSSTAA